MKWLTDQWNSLAWSDVLTAVGVFAVSLGISFAALAIVAVKIPRNYFSSHYRNDFLPNSSWIVRSGATILKNIVGIFLIMLGIVLSLPGIPGQGILTILLGLILVDIPGKRPLECRIVKWPA